MRQIKFRAKIVEGGGWKHHEKWVYGNFFKGYITMENGDASHFGDQKDAYIVTDNGVVWRVDINTVSQFTGLLDNKGKEIYEADILRWCNWVIDSPEAKDENRYRNRVVNWGIGKWILDDDKYWSLGIYSNIEIIGNIYENPELIK